MLFVWGFLSGLAFIFIVAWILALIADYKDFG